LGNGEDLDGPSLGFINFVVIGCFLIMREIVISLMLARSVRLDNVKKFVHIFLPASKTDPAALTTTKSWSCVYNDDRNLPRPYHAMVDQFVPLKERIGDAHGKLPEGLPAFPQSSGEAVAKERVVVCLEALAVLLGLLLFAPDGKRAFGGHTFRVSGARHFAYRGLEMRIIMLLEKWESEGILRYIKRRATHAWQIFTELTGQPRCPPRNSCWCTSSASVRSRSTRQRRWRAKPKRVLTRSWHVLRHSRTSSSTVANQNYPPS